MTARPSPLLLSAAVLSALALAGARLTARDTLMPVGDVKPGMVGIGRTVFQGDRCVPSADCDFAEHAEVGLAAHECYVQAGITDPAAQIQVVEMYDPFSSFQFPELEAMGFCARGMAARLSDEGVFDMDGRVAVGPSGGTLCTNPIGVTGLVRVADAALQVMGRAGAMQVADVKNALATAAGGSAQFFTCTLLSDEPRRARPH